MYAPAKVLLKVVSVLFIIFGSIASVASIIGLVGGSTPGMGGDIVVTAMIVSLVLSIFELVLGIVGLRRSENPEHANFFLISGVVLCVVALISMILSFQVTSLIGFVLPILFIIGGAMQKNTPRQSPA